MSLLFPSKLTAAKLHGTTRDLRVKNMRSVQIELAHQMKFNSIDTTCLELTIHRAMLQIHVGPLSDILLSNKMGAHPHR